MKRLILSLLVIIMILLLISCRPPEIEATVRAMNRGQKADAFEYAQMAIEKYPGNPEAWFYWGWLIGEYKKDYDEMNKAFARTISINPIKKMSYSDTTITISESINRLRNKLYVENMNPGIRAVKAAKELNTNDPDRAKMVEDAIKKFIIAKHIDSSRSETYLPLAEAYLLAEDTARAVQTILFGTESHPQDVDLHLQAGDIYAIAGNEYMAKAHYCKAAEIHYDLYSSAIDIQPEDITLSSNIAISLYENRQYKVAIPYFIKVVECVPTDQDPYKFLGSCYVKSNMPDEGIAFLEKTVELYPNEPLFWEYLAFLYSQKGLREKADAAYRQYESLTSEQ